VTTAAEALDDERLHALIFVRPARSASPDRGRDGAEAPSLQGLYGLIVAAKTSWETGPFPVHETATTPGSESMPR
jgi:hypothetical protein